MRARPWLRLKIGAGHVVRAEPDELDFQDGISRTSKSPSVLSVNDRVSPRPVVGRKIPRNDAAIIPLNRALPTPRQLVSLIIQANHRVVRARIGRANRRIGMRLLLALCDGPNVARQDRHPIEVAEWRFVLANLTLNLISA